MWFFFFFFFSSRRRHTSFDCDWSSDVCSSDLARAVEFTFEELSRAAQTSQRILDFVSQVADQLPIGAVLGHALLLSFDAQPLVDRPQLEQQRGLWQLDRRYDAVKVQGLLARRNEDQVLISEAALSANRLTQQGC